MLMWDIDPACDSYRGVKERDKLHSLWKTFHQWVFSDPGTQLVLCLASVRAHRGVGDYTSESERGRGPVHPRLLQQSSTNIWHSVSSLKGHSKMELLLLLEDLRFKGCAQNIVSWRYSYILTWHALLPCKHRQYHKWVHPTPPPK